jgi:hypothetical protein
MKTNMKRLITTGVLTAAWFFAPNPASAHCDTLDGPVVTAAEAALEKKEITPALKWIKPEHEAELKAAFARTLAVRSQGREARELADQFFFEALVRLHREGEGAPYAGLKPGGTKIDPAVVAADRALDSGKVDDLIKTLTDETAAGIRQLFTDAVEKKRHAEHSVDAGRDYVAAYVEFVHHVEALHAVATRKAAPHGHSEPVAPPTEATHHNH